METNGRRSRVAVIGGGISGLSAASRLAEGTDVTLFERDSRLGGHARTVAHEDGGRSLGLDTGFLVYNERTYPGFSAMLSRLGVETQESEMSLGISCGRCAIAWSGRTIAGLFAMPLQAARPSFWKMLAEIPRYHREAKAFLAAGTKPPVTTCGEFLESAGFSDFFARHFLLPMGAAIWSTPHGRFRDFPFATLAHFLDNHGLLALEGQPTWRTVTGGSRRYVDVLAASLDARIVTGRPVRSIERPAGSNEVRVRLDGGEVETFDAVVVATHSDEALALLADADEDERRALSAIPYQPNRVTLHTDTGVLPRSQAAHAAWNVALDDCRLDDRPLTMIYHLNRLQRLGTRTTYLVSVNDPGRIREETILSDHETSHPLYTANGMAARKALRVLSGRRRTHWAGAWLGYGFHEDGFASGLEAAREIEAAIASRGHEERAA